MNINEIATNADDLPFTPKTNTWAQDEYCHCMERGFGFSAHGDVWHYKIGDRGITLSNPTYGTPKVIRDEKIKNSLCWVEELRKAHNRRTS